MSGTNISLEAAKKVKSLAQNQCRYPDNHVNSSKKLSTGQSKHLPDSEAGDPETVDHTARGSTKLVPSDYDIHELPKPLVECGCGDCSEQADPLADDSYVFRDVCYAQQKCSEPSSMSVERASEVYLIYQQAAKNDPIKTSLLERTRNQHGVYIGAEQKLRERMDDPTVIFLSLRVSPTEVQHGRKRWIPPVALDNRLSDSWRNVKSVLDYQLDDFWWEYCWVTATTDSAATPHRHVVVYVDDPNNEVSIEIPRAAVNSFVNNTQGAESSFHSVESEQSDAGNIFYDPPLAEKANESRAYGIHGDPYRIPTVHLYYALNQRPHWALENVYDGTSDIHANSVDVQGAAVAWASPNNWLGSSDGFPT